MTVQRQSLVYFKAGNVYSAEHECMRYKMYKTTNEDKQVLTVCVWQGPWCFDKTDEEQKIYNSFEISDEGINTAIDWICNTFEEKFSAIEVPKSLF